MELNTPPERQASWQGKLALITGGGTGIGFALAARLLGEGMDVVIASTNEDRLNAAATELRALSRGRVEALRCDVADRSAVRALADVIADQFGPVGLLCANAGATTIGSYADHDDKAWDWAIDLNLGGVVNCVQAFYPDMVARGSGAILLTGSQTSLVPDWVLGHGPYVPAKAAVFALAFALRAEAAAHGVGVSLLLPSATETAVAEHARPVSAAGAGLGMREDFPMPSPPIFLSADEVAARAVSGLKANAALIATHAGMRPLVEDYFARVLSAYDDAEAWSWNGATP